MSTVIQIDFQVDRARAIDVLSDAGETYCRALGNRFIVSNQAPRLLQVQGIRLTVLGRPEEREET